jgi:hypothetical protein
VFRANRFKGSTRGRRTRLARQILGAWIYLQRWPMAIAAAQLARLSQLDHVFGNFAATGFW